MSNKNDDHYFFEGGGEMGELIRAKDWNTTSLGDPSGWPQSLCTMVAMMLNNPFGMYIAWGKDYIQLYNDGYRPILGVTKHPQALGIGTRETFSEIWHIIESMFDDVMQGKAVGFPDFMLPLNRNGFVEECYFDFSYSPIKKDNGEVGGVLVTVIETTNKKKAEEALKESEQRFRDTVKQAPIGITILRGKEYVVEMANDTYMQLIDREVTEFVGKPLFESLPEVEESVHALLDNVLNTGFPFHDNEVPVPINRYGKQEVYYFDFLYYPLKEKDGTISGIIVTVTEVSEKVATAKKNKENEKLLQSIFSNAPAAIAVITGSEHTYVLANNEYQKMVSRTSEQLVGKTSKTIFPELVGTGTFEIFDNIYQSGESFSLAEYPVKLDKNNDGKMEQMYFRFSAVPLKDAAGKFDSIVIVSIDITEQVETRKKIEESKELFSNFGNSIQNLAWIAEGDGNIFWYNQRWMDYTGLTLDEMKGWGWQKVHHPDHVERIVEMSKKLWVTNEPFELTFPLRQYDGQYRWFLTRAVPISDEHGKIYRWIGTNTDITEQKEIQDLLIESENRYRLLADNIPMITFIIEPNAEATLSYLNKTWLDYTGQTYEEALGRAWEGFIHPEDVQGVLDIYVPAFEKRQSYFVPAVRVKRHDGIYRWHLFTANPRYLPDGEFMGYIGVGFDIHNQKVAEDILKESEERFRSLAQTLPQLVWVTDALGNAEFASSRWEDYTGIEPNGENEWKAVVHPDDYDGINAAWSHSLTTGNIYKYDVRLKSKDADYRWFTVKGEPVLNKENKIVKWVGAFTDIHEQKIKEEKKDEFISIASHELKTPLTTVKAYLQMLELYLKEHSEEANLYARKASDSVNRLNELISELLDVSKIRLGKLNYTITTFNFNDMIDSTVENIQLTSSTHTIMKTGKINDEVSGDKDRLQQVIINLLTNAIKYSPRAEKVFINLSQQGDSIKVSVKDSGIGIAQQSLDKIFEKYHRVEEHAIHFQGLGIGLFISYEIIQRHHGTLWAESEPGKGSTFYFTLPLGNNLTL